MGCCFSSHSHHLKPTADVISLNGELRRYPLPVTASQVLHFEAISPDSFFLCNSDRLFFDDYVPCLHPEDDLDPAQIYFVLPVSKLQHRLAPADMAALAVKASGAINASSPRGRSRKARICPSQPSPNDVSPVQSRKASARPELGVRKLHKYSSRRAKLAVRSFRMRLTTINEGSVLLN